MTPTRLLLINYEYPPLGGGAGNATRYLARELAARGAEVCVLTSAFEDLPRDEQTEGFRIRRVRVLRRRADRCTPIEMTTFMIAATCAALRETRRWRPTGCIAFFGIPSGPVAFALKLLRRVPYVVSLRGGDVPGFQPYDLAGYHRVTKPLITFLWRRAQAVVANSEGLRQLAAQSTPKLDITVIPNGVDTNVFHPAPALQSRLTSIASATEVGEGGTPDTPHPTPDIRLLFVGRLTRQKGLDVLLDALAQLPGSCSWALKIVGDGDLREALEQQAALLGLKARVSFSGWCDRDQLPERYRQADIYVQPSRDEGMPNTVLEAMASGLPTIATNIAGCEELIEDCSTGLLVEPDNQRQLTAATEKLIVDTDLRKRLGTAARQHVSEHYAWPRVAAAYLALFPANR